MRTTLNIDDDIFEMARGLSDSRRISIGKALSDLARRGSQARAPSVSNSGFFTFEVNGDLSPFGPKEVRGALDSEGSEIGVGFIDAGRPS